MVHKKDFIDRLRKKGHTKQEARAIIDDFLQTLEEALVSGESVSFQGFGTFRNRELAGRVISSPFTDSAVNVPARHTVHFRASDILKQKVKSGGSERHSVAYES